MDPSLHFLPNLVRSQCMWRRWSTYPYTAIGPKKWSSVRVFLNCNTLNMKAFRVVTGRNHQHGDSRTVYNKTSVWIITVGHWSFSVQNVAMAATFLYCWTKQPPNFSSSHISTSDRRAYYLFIDGLHCYYISTRNIVNIITIIQTVVYTLARSLTYALIWDMCEKAKQTASGLSSEPKSRQVTVATCMFRKWQRQGSILWCDFNFIPILHCIFALLIIKGVKIKKMPRQLMQHSQLCTIDISLTYTSRLDENDATPYEQLMVSDHVRPKSGLVWHYVKPCKQNYNPHWDMVESFTMSQCLTTVATI